MKPTNEYIQQLLIEKIAGTIDANDDTIIEQLLLENKDVMHQWEVMQYRVKQAETEGFLIEGDPEKSWQQLSSLMAKSRKPKMYLGRIAAAAAVLAIIITGIYFFKSKEKGSSTMANLSPLEMKRNVTLSLEGGETIFLKNSGSGSFRLGAATIKTNEAVLSYVYPKTEVQQWSTLSVPPVFDYKIILADGTEVWMNSETTLRFPFSFPGKTREVYVKGEAYFKVAKNALQPFIVHTNETTIKVLGTSFNVNTYDPDKVTTALVEGAVVAGIGNKLVHLKPGFEAIYNAPQKGFRVEAFDESEVLSWLNGVYYFHNAPLRELSKILTRWYNVKVEFNDPMLQNKTFSGEILKKQTIQFFLDNIKLSNQMNTDLRNGVVTFR